LRLGRGFLRLHLERAKIVDQILAQTFAAARFCQRVDIVARQESRALQATTAARRSDQCIALEDVVNALQGTTKDRQRGGGVARRGHFVGKARPDSADLVKKLALPQPKLVEPRRELTDDVLDF